MRTVHRGTQYDLINALIAHAPMDPIEAGKFRQLARLLASIFHYEYFNQLEKLRMIQPNLDDRIESWLRRRFGLDLN